MNRQARDKLRLRYEQELFERVLPFWEQHSLDLKYGGLFNNLDRDGTVYDTTKHMWLLARQVWMFSKLYRMVEPRQSWLSIAESGMTFLAKHALRPDGRVFFAVARNGQPIYQQRKIFSECFYALALAEYARAIDHTEHLEEAMRMVERIWDWAYDWSKVNRPSLSGAAPAQMLAVPLMLLHLIDEVMISTDCSSEINDCFKRIALHVHGNHTFEYVSPDGHRLDGPNGRLINPGHVIEAGWFLQKAATKVGDSSMIEFSRSMIRNSQSVGWDDVHGGLYYFVDAEGFSPVQLEWSMKLWWPHCEALYAHLLNYANTSDSKDLVSFQKIDDYVFSHFVDPEYGEWYGYCDREGRVTHRFKGGPYKGCFHVPRALLLCWQLLQHWPLSAD
ncbi:MAG: AGE family epimerase/isomerase [Bacteroidetes bacterium]|nr:AGE family epimerase/isomerase [Bacteroidota bacterium]MCY4204980.1 AGE family epimerase/isomerase [Bacteroidota bacterium]